MNLYLINDDTYVIAESIESACARFRQYAVQNKFTGNASVPRKALWIAGRSHLILPDKLPPKDEETPYR